MEAGSGPITSCVSLGKKVKLVCQECFLTVANLTKTRLVFNFLGTGWGKVRFTVVYVENNTIINNNTRISPVFRTLTSRNLHVPHPYCQIVYPTISSF